MVTFQIRTRSSLEQDGFATSTVVAAPGPEPLPDPPDPLALPPERDDEAPPDGGPWLDDPSFDVEAWLLGLARRLPVEP